MADPVITLIPADTWTKVATAVTSGFIHILSPTDKEWYQTHKDTGGSVPTEEPEVKLNFQSEAISSLSSIDVYVYHKNSDGRIRVDL